MAGLLTRVFGRSRDGGLRRKFVLRFERFESRAMLAGDSAGEPPSDITLSGWTVDENLPSGTLVGVLAATDPDPTDTFLFELVPGDGDTDNASFQIVDGELLTSTSFDYETDSSLAIRIAATDTGGLSFEKSFTILVNDVNEAPSAITLSPSTVAEHEPIGTAVGTFFTTDPDDTEAFTYFLTDGEGANDNSLFVVDGDTLRTNAIFDYELQGTFSIRVASRDAGGLTVESPFQVTIRDVDAPERLALSTHVLPSQLPADSFVASISALADGPVSFALVSGDGDSDNSLFTVVDSELRLATDVGFTELTRLFVRVRATDALDRSSERFFPLVVLPGNPTEQTLHEGRPLTGEIDGSVGTDVYVGIESFTEPGWAYGLLDATITDMDGDSRIVAVQSDPGPFVFGAYNATITLGDGEQLIDVWLDSGNYAYGLMNSTMTFGDGPSTVTINAVEGGPGPDARFFWQVTGIYELTFDAGGGEDTLDVHVEASKNESFRSYGGAYSNVAMGDGDDTVSFSVRNTSGLQESIVLLSSTFDLGLGNDRFTAISTGGGLVESTLTTGLGDDVVDITTNRTAAHGSTIDVGDGDDIVVLRCSSGNHPDLYESSVHLGNGDDYVDLGSAIDGFIDGGDGFDILRLRGSSLSYRQTEKADGSLLLTRDGDDFFSLVISNIEVIQFGDLVTVPAYSGAPLSGYLTGSSDQKDLYYGKSLGSGIDGLRIYDTEGPDTIFGEAENAYVSTGIGNSHFVFGDQDISLQANVLSGYYNRAFAWGSLTSGAGSTNLSLSVGSSVYFEAAVDESVFDLGDGNDLIDITVSAGNPFGTLGGAAGMLGASVNTGSGDDTLQITAGRSDASEVIRGISGSFVDLGTGNDVLTIDSRGRGVESTPFAEMAIVAGDGHDFVWISSHYTAISEGSLSLGSGDDFAALLTADLNVPTMVNGWVDMGEGDDELVVVGRALQGRLSGGNGADRLLFRGLAADYRIDPQADGSYRIVYKDDDERPWIVDGFEILAFEDGEAEGFSSSAAGQDQADFEITGAAFAYELLTVQRVSEDPEGIPLDNFTVAWQWSDVGSEWLDIATGRSFRPSTDHVGGALRAMVTYVDSRGIQKTAVTPPTTTIERGDATDPTPSVPPARPALNLLSDIDVTGVVSLAGTEYTAARIDGFLGNANIVGNDFGNTLLGGLGDDSVTGGSGNDLFVGGSGPGDDTYEGGAGRDIIRYTSAESSITVDLARGIAEGEDIDVDVIIGIEDVIGGRGPDMLVGDLNDNNLWGHYGDDIIRGGHGFDILYGNEGDDEILGEFGDDFIDGGPGQDVAVFVGKRSEYVVQRHAEGGYSIADTAIDRDGTDIALNVEVFRFSDASMDSILDRVANIPEGVTSFDTNWYSGDDVIVKRGNGRLILESANTHTGGLRVEAGTVIIRDIAALNGGPLTIWGGATVLHEAGMDLVDVASLSLDSAGRFDVGTGGIRVAAGGFDAGAFRQSLIDGRHRGGWDGTTGITYTDAAAAGVKASSQSFAIGYSVSNDGVLVARYTVDGDSQLDGKVDFDDILALFPNYGGSGSYVWAQGDFTYDGKVDFDDILALFPNYGATGAFGAVTTGMLGGSGSQGLGGSGSGSGSGASSGDANGTTSSGDLVASFGASGFQASVMGPQPPDSLRQRGNTVLTRPTVSSSPRSLSEDQLSATSLAFAALTEDGDGQRQRSTTRRPADVSWHVIAQGS